MTDRAPQKCAENLRGGPIGEGPDGAVGILRDAIRRVPRDDKLVVLDASVELDLADRPPKASGFPKKADLGRRSLQGCRHVQTRLCPHFAALR